MNPAVEWLETQFEADQDLISRWKVNFSLHLLTAAEEGRLRGLLRSRYNVLFEEMFTLHSDLDDFSDVSWRPRHIEPGDIYFPDLGSIAPLLTWTPEPL